MTWPVIPVQETQEAVPQAGAWMLQWKLKVPTEGKVMVWGQEE